MIFLVLRLDKFADALLSDEFQVILHAHPVFASVSLVHPIDLPARIHGALKAKGGISSRDIPRPGAILEELAAMRVQIRERQANDLRPRDR